MKLIFDKYRESFQIIGYKQFDSLEPLRATFLNNGNPIDLSQYYIRFECKKPDGNIVIDDENIVIKNICEIEMLLNEQVTVVNGKVQCEFVLVSKTDERQTSTFTFELDIQQSVIGINGYSSSLITVAERLHKDVIESRKLHEDLTQDILTGNETKAELVRKTDIAVNVTDTLMQKTNEGNNTISGLVEKNATAKATDLKLNQTIITAKETDRILNESNVTADGTNAMLQMTIDSAVSDINKIIKTQNKYVEILSTQFVNGQYTFNHNMGTKNLVANILKLPNLEPLQPDYQIIDDNNILIRNKDNCDMRVVLNGGYWNGHPVDGRLYYEEIVGSDEIKLKDPSGYKYPKTKSSLVVMTGGDYNLDEKIVEIQNSLNELTNIKLEIENLKNSIPSSSIKNYAKFNKGSIKKGYEIGLYGGNLSNIGLPNANAVIDEFIPIDSSSKYEILVYQAEEIYIAEYSKGVYTGQTKLSSGYKWVYGSDSSLVDYGSTYLYTSQSAFSCFTTKSSTDSIKISFKCSDYTTNSAYYPNSNTLMLDNAINSLKIVKVSQGV